MPKPSTIEWDLPADIHGRRMVLVRTASSMGKLEYRLRQEASSQRDETTIVFGLSLETLKAIGEIAAEERR